MNVYMVVGRLSRDPELRESKSGSAICKLSVPTDDGWGERKKTTWHDVVCFGKTAEAVARHKKKGDWVSCRGRLEKETWEDRDGNKRLSVTLVADEVSFVGNKGQGGYDQLPASPGADDEIPF